MGNLRSLARLAAQKRSIHELRLSILQNYKASKCARQINLLQKYPLPAREKCASKNTPLPARENCAPPNTPIRSKSVLQSYPTGGWAGGRAFGTRAFGTRAFGRAVGRWARARTKTGSAGNQILVWGLALESCIIYMYFSSPKGSQKE